MVLYATSFPILNVKLLHLIKDNNKVITKYINFLPEKSIFPPEISKVSTRNIKKFQPDETKCQPFK